MSREKLAKPNRPQEPKPPFPYKEETVSYKNGEIKFEGTLTIPAGKGPFPSVLLITGSGPEDRNEEIFGHKPFLLISDYLTRAGIAVLRVDDRGVGGSTGRDTHPTTADFAQDAMKGVEFLRGRPEIDPKRIGLIGHSEGGFIAPMLASQSDEIAFVVMLAGTGVPGDEIIERQTDLIYRAGGMKGDSLKTILDNQRAIHELLKSGADSAKVRELLYKQTVSAMPGTNGGQGLTPEQKTRVDAMVNQQVHVLTSPWFRYFLATDPRPFLRKVKVPVLALNGERDLQVDPKQNLPEVEKALKEGEQGRHGQAPSGAQPPLPDGKDREPERIRLDRGDVQPRGASDHSRLDPGEVRQQEIGGRSRGAGRATPAPRDRPGGSTSRVGLRIGLARSSPLRDQGSSDVVDPEDPRSIALEGEDAHRGEADFEPGREVDRDPAVVGVRRADRIPVGDDRDRSIRVALPQALDPRDDPGLRLDHHLPAGDAGCASGLVPPTPARVLAKLLHAASGPFPVVDLDERVIDIDREAAPASDRFGGLSRALEGARVDRLESNRAEPLPESLRLADPLGIEMETRSAARDIGADRVVRRVSNQEEDHLRASISRGGCFITSTG